MFATGATMGLAEWIVDDTCLVNFVVEIILCMPFSTHCGERQDKKKEKKPHFDRLRQAVATLGRKKIYAVVRDFFPIALAESLYTFGKNWLFVSLFLVFYPRHH